MKNIKVLIVGLLISISSFAQQGINYKALIKDDLGNVLANTFMNVQFTIHQTTATGTVVYQEDHNYTTDANGLIILNIGTDSTPSVGMFADIDWSTDLHYLQTTISYIGGTIDFDATQFMAVPYALSAANVSGLEQITEENLDTGYTNIGWRLIGESPDFHGYIGYGALDLSIGISDSTKGATGIYSFASGIDVTASGDFSLAMGDNTEASGEGSTALGRRTKASGEYSTAMGYFTEASVEYSTAMGNNTLASGMYSTAMGFSSEATGTSSTAIGDFTEASGEYSTAMGTGTTALNGASTAMGEGTVASGISSTALGSFTTAFGQNSTAMGSGVKAEALNSLAIGCYNVGGFTVDPDPSYSGNINWVSEDPLFEIGNGSSNNNRSNALTVLKNAKTGINTSNPRSLFEVVHGNTDPTASNRTDALSIKNSVINDSWQFHVGNTNGSLILFKDGSYRGYFDWSSGAYVQASDRKLKKDITPLNNGTLQKVMQLNPVSYLMKDQKDTKRNLGLISQEVQELFPSITHYVEAQDILSLSYTELIPILIKALQEQQDIIDGQQSTIEAQKLKDSVHDKAILEQDKSIDALVARLNLLESKTSN